MEKDRTNGGTAAGDGGAITIQGTTYGKGLGTHAAADISYYLGGACTTMSANVGVDDDAGPNGSVVFQLYRDSTKVADSGTLTGNDPAKLLTADLTGGQQLRLVVTDAGDAIAYDHADWGDAKITCS